MAGNTNTDTPTSQALAKVDNTPRAMVERYKDKFAQVLPSHIARPETWMRVAQLALKKGKRTASGQTELEIAASNNVGLFLATLLDAARLGLEPGTEQYYLTPRKVKNRLEVLGIIGYQGHIELMYRAGAVSSVVAEVVYERDQFRFRPGLDEIPVHEIDWDADDRGKLRLVYAFARMKDGSTSKVVVLNRQAIERIKASSQGANGDYSPWKRHEPSMWLKSAVRQLAKWVPTSAEYRNEQLRGQAAVDEARIAITGTDDDMPVPLGDAYSDDDEIEAELVETGDGQEWAPGEEPFE